MIMDNDVPEIENIESASDQRKENDTKAPNREKKHSKEEKTRKKDIKGVEQILRGLGSFDSVEDKLLAVCKKQVEVLEENRKNQQTIKQLEKKVQMIQREKDQIYAERNKAFLTRSKLESLCRELQKQYKSVKEESLLKIREEEEKRKEVSTKFQNTLAEITALMNQNNEENAKLHEDKMELTKKFNVMHEQMERFEKLHKEIKLEMTEEKEALLKEKQRLLFKLAEYHTQVQEHQATEAKLRSKISMYNDKYDEFQNALTKSNEVFGGFNEEMEKMSKKIVKLEKETSVWKQRWESTHSSLLEVTADKQTLNRKCLLLQELCRGFQQERATLIAQLKEKNRCETENLEEESNVADKMTRLSSDRKQLQDNLEALSQKEQQKSEKKIDAKKNKKESEKKNSVVKCSDNVCNKKLSSNDLESIENGTKKCECDEKTELNRNIEKKDNEMCEDIKEKESEEIVNDEKEESNLTENVERKDTELVKDVERKDIDLIEDSERKDAGMVEDVEKKNVERKNIELVENFEKEEFNEQVKRKETDSFESMAVTDTDGERTKDVEGKETKNLEEHKALEKKSDKCEISELVLSNHQTK